MSIMVNQGDNYTSTRTFYDEENEEYIDPDTITIDILDPNNTIILTNQPATKDDTGKYHYNYQFPLNSILGAWIVRWNVTIGTENITINDTVTLESNTDLCTYDEIKIESLGRIKDDTLKDTINYKIRQLSQRIKDKAHNQELTREDSDANMACIYGVLAWLVQNKQIKENKKISSIKDSNFSINFTNSNTTEDNESTDCKIYKGLLLKLMPGPVLGDV